MQKASQKNGRIRGILRFGIDPITILIIICVTLFFGIAGNSSDETSLLNKISNTGFYISLSIAILQMLIQNFFLKENTESLMKNIDNLNKKISSTECIVFPEKKSYINNQIENALNSHTVRKMKIICYGTSKFGRVIDAIITTHTSVQVDVIVCSPDQKFFDLKSDKQLLINVIEELAMAKNINIFESKIPPTIRASVMYGENDKPIWCSIQPYYIFPSERYKLFKGEGFTPSLIADTSNETLLNNLVEIFTKEYNRLFAASQKVTENELKRRKEEE